MLWSREGWARLCAYVLHGANNRPGAAAPSWPWAQPPPWEPVGANTLGLFVFLFAGNLLAAEQILMGARLLSLLFY